MLIVQLSSAPELRQVHCSASQQGAPQKKAGLDGKCDPDFQIAMPISQAHWIIKKDVQHQLVIASIKQRDGFTLQRLFEGGKAQILRWLHYHMRKTH